MNVIKWYCDVRTTRSLLKYDTEKSEFTVIGHPVMIGDCLDWYEKEVVTEWCGYKFSCYFEKHISDKWKSKRLPIDDQSDDCIDYIHSLIK